jgi:hypothetical protein
MYLPGQIVYDLDKKEPVCIGDDVWEIKAYPLRHTHFIKAVGTWCMRPESAGGPMNHYQIALPKTVAEARELLDKNLIVPAPCTPTHCWKCGNWKSNCASFKKCSEWRNSKKGEAAAEKLLGEMLG